MNQSAAPAFPIRDATTADAAACAAIYAPYVLDTAISFEEVPPTTEEMAARIENALQEYAWLVLEREGAVVGYAYGGRFAPRAAYRYSCEVSVYLKLGEVGKGGGRALYTELLDRLAQRGYQQAFGGYVLPNLASEALHRSMGFRLAGVNRKVGHKLGAWRDVAWVQRDLATLSC
ncbi:GCN5-related N-acetyltransferase [Segniliparus rotundus DSM 44985]|uniref:GCN5-related N-acetyltransferase n=1 Tax=Segniliparus rotundus (strain ATCC BAA-972 / CDC 1076 / CIP 108378 / DSM 44985 / JCM 13578) TaxID=640132 RepID=D6Z7D9_SEGRD|nr:GNAT family N-acetyltransferase [Segniliparus rotundus]ADG97869.1 GCN5-related N-acetyltransferase [Segniliparus rotundus DSM 44985]